MTHFEGMGDYNMSDSYGFFQLVNKPGGMFIKVYPGAQGTNSMLLDDIVNYFGERKIMEYDLQALRDGLISATEPVEIKIGFAETPIENEYLKITIDPEKMFAIGRFFAPSTGGNRMDKNLIVSELIRAGIKYGVQEDVIDDFLNNRTYCSNLILAKGTMPVEGKNAVINYKFRTGTSSKPKINDDGTVDFHQLDMINHVNKGDILAVLEPADQGTPGIDVYGNTIRPKKVIKKILKHGINIHLSEDGTIMYADVSGHVSLTDDRVFVSDTFEVPDVNAATGDITYEGNVVVKGNVLTGFSIRAKGDIIVNGVVEGATLVAEGQIILKRGIQGMNRGILDAKGNIVAKFIENSEVRSGGIITTEAIMHSNVSAKGEIIVGGKKGLITGGEIKSGSSITVKTVGSAMGTHTLLEVGIDPSIMDEFRDLEKSITDMQTEKEKMIQILVLFRKKVEAGEQLTPDKAQYLRTANQNNILLETKIREATSRYESLSEEVNNYQSGRIRIENVAYPGVKIVISNVTFYIRQDTHHCQFIRDKADIKSIGL